MCTAAGYSQPITFASLAANTPVCAASGSGNCIILPITLLQFEARRQSNNAVLVQWKTTHEVNNAGFEMQRCLGNPFSFETRAFVRAQISREEKKEYELKDNNSFPGISYYRLKQLNTDGQFVYSNIVAVNGYATAESITVYPNPVQADLHTSVVANSPGKAELTVLTIEGKAVLHQQRTLQQGANRVEVDAVALPKGVYLVQVLLPSGGQVYSKFIKE